MDETPSFVSKNLQRIRAVARNPAILPLWLRWLAEKKLNGNPALKIHGSEFRDFPHFNAYLGTWQYRPDDDEIAFLRAAFSDASVILDVGANFGVISAVAARSRPDARIFAFEPHPGTASSCHNNLRRNGLTNVTLQQQAVGRTKGEIGFTSHGSPASNRIAQDAPADIQVPLTTLEQFSEEHELNMIDFLKIDVEGADVDVLEGGRRLFKGNRIKRGMIEVCPATLVRFGATVDDMISFFRSVSFDFRWYTTGGKLGAAVTSSEAESRGLANAVFVSRLAENRPK